MEAVEKAKKFWDGWSNILTGFGIENRDRTKSTLLERDSFLQEKQQAALYVSDGFGRRVVELPVKEMTRKGFIVEGDAEGEIVDYYKKRGFAKIVRNILRWSKVYGGAVGVMRIDDGGALDSPLNMTNIRKIEKINVYHRWRVDRQEGVDKDVNSKTYGETMFYRIQPISGGYFNVHRDRILLIDGLELSDDERINNSNWGLSVYQSTREAIKRFSSLYGIVESIMDEFETSTISIENLQEMIATGQEAVVKQRLNLLDLSKHVINTRLLDSRETFDKKSSSVAGVAEILDKYAENLSAVTGIPITLLMGRSPAGMNSTGESDVRLWYDNVSSEQEEILSPVLTRLLTLIQLEKDGPTKGKLLEKWSIKFNPLWQMNEKDESTVKKTIAEADKIYIESGVLLPNEVAISRFGGDKYSMETEIDVESREQGADFESQDEPDDDIQ